MHATPLPPPPRRTIVVRRHGNRSGNQRFLSSATDTAHTGDSVPVDWRAQAQLATVLTVIAVIVAVGLSNLVPGPLIVFGMTGVSALVAWHRLEPLPDRRTPADVLRH
ncbi:MAG: hypothetical protein ACO3C1_09070 [Ilumatobacteraceae bacterium]